MKFLDLLEQFKPRFRDRPDENSEAPLEELEEEEEFFTLIAEITDKIGQWCLEIYQNQEKMLPTQEHQQ